MKRTKSKGLEAQIKSNTKKKKHNSEFAGNTEVMISTGSTLLDLEISGRRKRGGGVPGGILVEIFGPESSGKTVLECEIGGAIQRQGGKLLFEDPEARLNKKFAQIFDIDFEETQLEHEDTVEGVFLKMNNWQHNNSGKINGILIDSLAALSTEMEMDKDEGDKMGMRRAKMLSEGWRKFARKIMQENYIVACTNQIRVKADAQAFGEQFTTPGGKATAFYASLRLKFNKPTKVKKEITFKGTKIKKVIRTEVEVEIYKSSIDKGYGSATLIIDPTYGIDDIRANLQYLKKYSNESTYFVNSTKLDRSLDHAVIQIEEMELEDELKEAVIDLWEEIEEKFKLDRKKKKR